MAEFIKIPSTGDRSAPFLKASQISVTALESITAAEKAQAVPFVRIWQIKPDGTPVHENGKDGNPTGKPTGPLTNLTATPPRFGAALSEEEDRYRERPPVSLERITIKTDNPRGTITYRMLELIFTVHRPDVLAPQKTTDHDTWGNLIFPGKQHVLEYGWTSSLGVKNGLLNGEGITDEGGEQKISVPARVQVRFTVTNYTFRIMANNEIQFTVQAYEDGEFNLRNATMGAGDPPENAKRDDDANTTTIELLTNPYDERGLKIVKDIKQQITKDLSGKGSMIRFEDLLNKMFAKTIEKAYRKLGYKEVNLYIGNFNELIGKPVDGKYRLPSKYIGDFEISLKEIQERFAKLITKDARQITVYNFLTPFMNIMNLYETWNAAKGKKDDKKRNKEILPTVTFRSVANPATGIVTLFIFDARFEFTKFTEDDFEDVQKNDGRATKEKLRDKLKKKNVPLISFGRGNSYILDATFEAMQDDQMKSIFINRYLKQDTKKKITKQPTITSKTGITMDAEKLLYSSALRGDVNMLGNFALDLFGLVWLDFGVDIWSGPFSVQTREDIIERGSFMTRLTFVAEGSDPLGTQGRRIATVKKA